MNRKLIEKKLVIATHNEGKIKEITQILSPFGLTLLHAKDLQLIEPPETGLTYFDNALLKAEACAKTTGLPSLADDSGIEVEALAGAPGVHTAPYTQEHGGRECVFALWQANEMIARNPRASFISVLVLAWPDGYYEHVVGTIDGRLQFPARGSGGHGYDPVFIPDGEEKTVAQMKMERINVATHRSIALEKLIKNCLSVPK